MNFPLILSVFLLSNILDLFGFDEYKINNKKTKIQYIKVKNSAPYKPSSREEINKKYKFFENVWKYCMDEIKHHSKINEKKYIEYNLSLKLTNSCHEDVLKMIELVTKTINNNENLNIIQANLSGNKLGFSRDKDAEKIKEFFEFLLTDCININLSNNHFMEIDEKNFFLDIIKSLKGSEKLKSLNICGNNFGLHDNIPFKEMYFKNLEILNISNIGINLFSEKSSIDFYFGIRNMISIKKLIISENNIGYVKNPKVIDNIFKGISRLEGLEYIDLSDNKMGLLKLEYFRRIMTFFKKKLKNISTVFLMDNFFNESDEDEVKVLNGFKDLFDKVIL